MARRSPLAAARGALVSMVLLMILMAAGIFGTTQAGGSWGAKLALDLSGGTQMILSPKVNGSNDTNVSQEQLKQAVEIIRQRVDGAGVSEAEVTTSFGSGNNVVVSVPGNISPETRELIQASANMTFRAVLQSSSPGTAVPEESRTPDDKLPSLPQSHRMVRIPTGLLPSFIKSLRLKIALRAIMKMRKRQTPRKLLWRALPMATRNTFWAR